jgi:hypothetical protein
VPPLPRGRLLVEVVRRPAGARAYRDAGAREALRIRHRLDWPKAALTALATVSGLALASVLGWFADRDASIGVLVGGVMGAIFGALLQWRLQRGAIELHPDEILVGGAGALPVERVRVVRQERTTGGWRVLLVLDDGQALTALKALSEQQAEYVARLLRDLADSRALPHQGE